MAMQFSVTGRQMEVGDALRRHIEENVSGIVGKYFGSGIEAHAVLCREAYLYCCDLSVHLGRNMLLQASEKDADPYGAADKAAECIAKRMRRYKRRLRDHHQNGGARKEQAWQAQYAILAAEPEEPEPPVAVEDDSGQPAVIAETTTEIQLLTVGEAVMQLDLADRPTLMFRNAAHGGLNVIYRRKDGHIGWIDPGAGSGRA